MNNKRTVILENGQTMTITQVGTVKEVLVLRDENDKVLSAKVVNYLKQTKQI